MITGTVSNASKFYSEQYRMAEEPLPQSEEFQALDEMQAELAAEEPALEGTPEGDFFIEGKEDAVQQRFSVAGLQTDLVQQEQALAAQLGTEPEHNEARRVHQSIQFFLKRLIPLGEDAAIPQYLMDEYLLLEGELGKVQLQLDTQTQVSGPLAQFEKLIREIATALNGVDLEDSLRQEMQALLPQLGKAKGALELATNPQAAAQAKASVEELLGQAEELVGGYQEEHEAHRGELEQAMAEFEIAITYSEARGYYRMKVWKKFAELKLQLEEGSLPLKEIALGLMELEAQLQDGVKKTEQEKEEKAEQEKSQKPQAASEIKVEGGFDPIGFVVETWKDWNTHEVG